MTVEEWPSASCRRVDQLRVGGRGCGAVRSQRRFLELPDDEHVALPQDAQAAVESRPVVAYAGGEVLVQVGRVIVPVSDPQPCFPSLLSAGKILPLRASKSIWRPVKGDEMAQNGGLRPSPYSVFLHESCRYPIYQASGGRSLGCPAVPRGHGRRLKEGMRPMQTRKQWRASLSTVLLIAVALGASCGGSSETGGTDGTRTEDTRIDFEPTALDALAAQLPPGYPTVAVVDFSAIRAQGPLESRMADRSADTVLNHLAIERVFEPEQIDRVAFGRGYYWYNLEDGRAILIEGRFDGVELPTEPVTKTYRVPRTCRDQAVLHLRQISMCRKRSFGTRGRGRLPASPSTYRRPCPNQRFAYV